MYSLSVSHVNDKLDPSQMVAASSALLLINGTAAAFGPLVTGAIMGAFGARAYFAILGTLTGALTLFDLWRKLRRGAGTEEPERTVHQYARAGDFRRPRTGAPGRPRGDLWLMATGPATAFARR